MFVYRLVKGQEEMKTGSFSSMEVETEPTTTETENSSDREVEPTEIKMTKANVNDSVTTPMDVEEEGDIPAMIDEENDISVEVTDLKSVGGTNEPRNPSPVDIKLAAFSKKMENEEGTREEEATIIPVDTNHQSYMFEKILTQFKEYLELMEQVLSASEKPTPVEEKQAFTREAQSFCGELRVLLQNVVVVGFDQDAMIDSLKCIEDKIHREGNHEGNLDIEPIAAKVTQMLLEIRPIDLGKLTVLLKKVDHVGAILKGMENIVLFLGGTGVGKTTTVLYLAGVRFEEVEVDGFDHLEPVGFHKKLDNDDGGEMKAFETSCRTKSTTKSLQATSVELDGENILLCDTPGFFDTEGAEVDIANGYGFVRAIHQAKAVKPIVVLSKDGMGDRFQGFSDVLETLSRLVGDGKELDLQPFGYVFTKYGTKDKKRLSKQFATKRRELRAEEKSNPMFVALLDDIIAKTAEGANIVLPLNEENTPRDVLRSILSSPDSRIQTPAKHFVPFVTEHNTAKLQLQLERTRSSLELALRAHDFGYLGAVLALLTNLASVYPAAAPYAETALSSIKTQAAGCLNRVHSSILQLSGRTSYVGFSSEVHKIKEDMTNLFKLNQVLGESCQTPDAEAKELASVIGRDLMTKDGANSGLLVTEDPETVLAALVRLEKVDRVFHGSEWEQIFSDACGYAVNNCLHSVSIVLSEMEKHTEDLKLFEKRAAAVYFLLRGLLNLGNDISRCAALENRRLVVMKSFDDMVTGNMNRCNSAVKRCEDARMGNLSLASFLDINFGSVVAPRNCIRDLSGMPSLCDMLPSRRNPSKLAKTVSGLESAIIDFLKGAVETSEKELTAFVEKQKQRRSQGDFTVALVDGACLQEQLKELENVSDTARNFAPAVDVEWATAMKRLVSTQSRLERYISDATKEAEAFASGVHDASDQAEAFLARLTGLPNKAGPLFKELAESGEWDVWLQAFKSQRSAFHDVPVIGKFFSAGDEATLGKTLQGIAQTFHKSLCGATRVISNMSHRRFKKLDIPQLLFQACSGEVVLFCEFLRFTLNNSSLAQSVWQHDDHHHQKHLQRELATAAGSLSGTFQAFQNISKEAFEKRNIFEMGVIIRSMKGSAALESSRTLAASIASSPGNRKLEQLSISIHQCSPYEELYREMVTYVHEVKAGVTNLTFDSILDSINEHDRYVFYSDIALSLVSLERIGKHFADLLPADETSGLPVARSQGLRRVQQETEKIGVRLHELMSSFPEVESDLSSISILIGNLASIRETFRDVDPQTSAVARKLVEDTDYRLEVRIRESRPQDSATPDEIFHYIMTLKKASREIGRLRAMIDTQIDRSLTERMKASKNVGKFVYNLTSALQSAVGADAVIARQIQSEHKFFEAAKNLDFHYATEKQDIDYVLGSLALPQLDADHIRDLYKSFVAEYKHLLHRGITALRTDKFDSFKQTLITTARVIASDFHVGYSDQVCDLMVHIFALWSLSNVNEFIFAEESDVDIRKHLMEPHPGQVVAIWRMLNCSPNKHQQLESHLVEVKTGEGKSIALGVSAIVLALLGCRVDCVSYSCYLSNRDSSAFASMFRDFGVHDMIRYGTLHDLCDHLLDEDGDLRDLTREIILGGGHNTNGGRSETNSQIRVMLVDEVDIFFKEDFHGQMLYPAALINDDNVHSLIRFIWKRHRELDSGSLLQSREANNCLEVTSTDLRPVIEEHMKKMLRCASIVGKGSEQPYIVSEGKIGYKQLDGTTFSSPRSYETAFVYLKEHQKGHVTEATMKAETGFLPFCGRVSFAELPVCYDVILGVTGTLRGLNEKERSALKDVYDIQQYSYIPSVFGENRLDFLPKRKGDVVLCSSKDDHFLELARQIDRCQQPKDGASGIQRSVMVFFDRRETLLEFYEKKGKQRQARTLMEEIPEREKEGEFLKATERGRVTLLIREYGRGTDFKCFDDEMLDSGGVHVIQAFFSVDEAEEIQMKGRSARQGKDGSYSMVIDAGQLERDLDISRNEFDEIRALSNPLANLAAKRRAKYNRGFGKLQEEVREAERDHYRTLAYRNALCRGENRREVVQFLLEQNRCGGSGAFNNSLKKKYLKGRKKRLDEHWKREKQRRRKTWRESAKSRLSTRRSVSHEETHYETLGLPRDATQTDIVQSHRSLVQSLREKTGEGTAEKIQLLTDARNYLLDEELRAGYDKLLREGAEDVD